MLLSQTPPPYGTTECKWDSIIPFDKMWERLNKLIKDNGAIVLFGSEPFSSKLRLSNLEYYKYDWYWHKDKSINFLHSKNMPLKNIEIAMVFSKGTIAHIGNKKRMPYNPQGVMPFNKTVKGKNKGGKLNGHRINRPSFKENYNREFTNYPDNVLTFKSDFEKLHPTQKPVSLMEYLIKTYTLENEIVLDFTMGSGTTGVGCVNTNRNFIGIELDKKYFEIAEKRIKEAKETIFDVI